MTNAIIVRGERIAVPFDVVAWTDPNGLAFPVRKNRSLTRAVCCHWTGGENPAAMVRRNMLATRNDAGEPAPTSVHFIVEPQGMVYQCADADARMSHARAHNANDWTVGIEVVCRGDYFAAPLRDGISRPRCSDVIQGRRCIYDSFTDDQMAVVVPLVEALCTAYRLPMRVPMRGDVPIATELSPLDLAKWRGVLGHVHLEQRKRDPGVHVLRAIAAHGATLGRPVG
jgi:N-acetyl-anhydromuramyl-L-alanine amidase AmpD